MKLSIRAVCALALGAAVIGSAVQADQPPGKEAPVVQLPQDAQRIVVATPMGGPTVTLPVREGIATTAPRVIMPALINPPTVHTAERGPVVDLPQR